MSITCRAIQETHPEKQGRLDGKRVVHMPVNEVAVAQPQPVVVVREDRSRSSVAMSSGSFRKTGNSDFL